GVLGAAGALAELDEQRRGLARAQTPERPDQRAALHGLVRARKTRDQRPGLERATEAAEPGERAHQSDRILDARGERGQELHGRARLVAPERRHGVARE